MAENAIIFPPHPSSAIIVFPRQSSTPLEAIIAFAAPECLSEPPPLAVSSVRLLTVLLCSRDLPYGTVLQAPFV